MASSNVPPNGRYSTSPDLQVDEIVVVPNSNADNIRYGPDGQPMLTKNGLPRRKPGPKPGTTSKRQSNQHEDGTEKVKKPRKPKDPNAPPGQRKRKNASAEPDGSESRSRAASLGPGAGGAAAQQVHRFAVEGDRGTTLGRLDHNAQQLPKRESLPGSMSKILNADPEPTSQPTPPPRISGTAYDPIRSSNYDPIRETMIPNSFSSSMGSPRAPVTATVNRASASPSIASLVDPVPNTRSPATPHTYGTAMQLSYSQTRKNPEPTSVPASPNPVRKEFTAVSAAPKPLDLEKPATVASAKIEIRPQSITTIGAAAAKRASSKEYSTASSPKDNAGGSERSILDFGKAEPGAELVAPSIVLNIPLTIGENNKYVNFMRMAEDQYGWDALHPRQAEAKARRARIAAAASALAQNDSSREGDEMSVDESENEDSNIEMGGLSGPDKPDGGKPIKKKKRHFKEDEYDREDDFVDDSEMLWEEQAAASRDGFFVYSGPLVPEPEKEAPGRRDGLPKRGRGSRGGRGGARGAGTGTGRGRGGGPGSRGGVVRKPRMTKADKAQLEKEKSEREANLSKAQNGAGTYNVLNPGSPQFAGL